MYSKSFEESSVLNKLSITSVRFGANNSIGDKLRIRRESPYKSMKNISRGNSSLEINEDGKEALGPLVRACILSNAICFNL